MNDKAHLVVDGVPGLRQLLTKKNSKLRPSPEKVGELARKVCRKSVSILRAEPLGDAEAIYFEIALKGGEGFGQVYKVQMVWAASFRRPGLVGYLASSRFDWFEEKLLELANDGFRFTSLSPDYSPNKQLLAAIDKPSASP